MKGFMAKDFLLENGTAHKLYFLASAKQPIWDYHCHLSPKEIADNRQFETLTDIWLGGDHYKWRQMRTAGIPEKYITGNADPYEKFLAWARTVERLMGNPLYHWTHLELQRYFGIYEPLSEKTATAIWKKANAMLSRPELSVKGIFEKMNVYAVGTTDDPVDSLEYHKMIADGSAAIGSIKTKVVPSFRPDRALYIEKNDFPSYIAQLSKAAGKRITNPDELIAALEARLVYFKEHGCRASDHALPCPPFAASFSDKAALAAEKKLAFQAFDRAMNAGAPDAQGAPDALSRAQCSDKAGAAFKASGAGALSSAAGADKAAGAGALSEAQCAGTLSDATGDSRAPFADKACGADTLSEAQCADKAAGAVALSEAGCADKADDAFKAWGAAELAAEQNAYRAYVLSALAALYKKHGIVMQLHFGATRSNNPVMFRALGPDTGFDACDDQNIAAPLSSLLARMEEQCTESSENGAQGLPRTILYSLNPKDYQAIGTLMGAFQGAGIGDEETVPGKIQLGAAWWFCDHRDGMETQLKALGNLGMLSSFVGMLTDSRSFLSYPRHEYFRRILCNLIGGWVEKGEYPVDMTALLKMVNDISFENARRFFD